MGLLPAMECRSPLYLRKKCDRDQVCRVELFLQIAKVVGTKHAKSGAVKVAGGRSLRERLRSAFVRRLDRFWRSRVYAEEQVSSSSRRHVWPSREHFFCW